MERIRLLFEQIDEAKRLMSSATSVLNFRIAMILLDNTAELIMNRELRSQFAWDDEWKSPRREARYTQKEREAAERFFEDKAHLLAKIGKLSKDQESVLIACHVFPLIWRTRFARAL